MKRTIGICLFTFLVVLFSQPLFAEEIKVHKGPWKEFSLYLGVFLSDISSDLRFGLGIGVDINVEYLLGMDAGTSPFWSGLPYARPSEDVSGTGLKATPSVGGLCRMR